MLPDTILRLPAVKAATGLSRSTIYERIQKGTFPSPIPLGDKAVGWLASEVGAWIQRRISEARPSLETQTDR
jgi:prophage regulatory protein